MECVGLWHGPWKRICKSESDKKAPCKPFSQDRAAHFPVSARTGSEYVFLPSKLVQPQLPPTLRGQLPEAWLTWASPEEVSDGEQALERKCEVKHQTGLGLQKLCELVRLSTPRQLGPGG